MTDASNPIAPGDNPGREGDMPPDTLTMNSVPGAGSIGDDDLTAEIAASDAELTAADAELTPSEAVRDPAPGIEPNE
ncbi:MAG: hypothetical protein JWP85_2057 [Rhodoglobus sp.]|nr:hypothetical protein [Rhodoglobus sp.]